MKPHKTTLKGLKETDNWSLRKEREEIKAELFENIMASKFSKLIKDKHTTEEVLRNPSKIIQRKPWIKEIVNTALFLSFMGFVLKHLVT